MKVLLIGGSEDVARTISIMLEVRWPELNLVHTSEPRESLELICREQPDLVMLHRDSLSMNCVDLISQIRGFADVPLIVLGQSNDVVDEVEALEMGADDWITRSCMPMEFIAKVNALLRRCPPRSNDNVEHFLNGELSINYAAHKVHASGKPVKLTPIEYKLLCQLAKNEGSVVSREKLLHTVWGPNYEVNPEYLKKYIWRLRSKIEEDLADPQIIVTERGVGYMLVKSADSIT